MELPVPLSFGISPALVTPFSREGVDTARLLAHAQDLLDRGCRSVTVFGTTGEGPSVGAAERDRVAAEFARQGVPAERLVEGVIASSIEEAVFSTGRALRRGAKAVLLAPPFYFRPAPDEAVFAWFAEVFRALGPDLRDIILYHIPGMTGVPISVPVIRRLVEAFPGAVLGVKDSACDAEATMALIEAFPDLIVLVGDESYLGRACAAGAGGSICGVANVAPEAVIALAEAGRDDPRVVDLVRAISRYPIIPIVKALVAEVKGDPAWAAPRPPLAASTPAEIAEVGPFLAPLRAPAGAAA
jgi:4-hydroxy-tetrahydrodipicolinate synthase